MKFIYSIIALLFFCNVSFADNEKTLANIRLNSESVNVLRQLGDPTEIKISTYESDNFGINTSFGKTFSSISISNQLTWIFKKDYYDLIIKIDNGKIVSSVAISGVKCKYSSQRNITLGSKYSEVLKKYGHPKHKTENETSLSIFYPDNNIKFTFNKISKFLVNEYKVSGIEISSFEYNSEYYFP